MSGRIRYTEEFKREAAAQVVSQSHSVKSVSERLGVSTKSIYDWVKLYEDKTGHADQQDKDEISNLAKSLAGR